MQSLVSAVVVVVSDKIVLMNDVQADRPFLIRASLVTTLIEIDLALTS